jgi:hypothetical protein
LVNFSWVAQPYYKSKFPPKISSNAPCNSFLPLSFSQHTTPQNRNSDTVFTRTAEPRDHVTQYVPSHITSS